MGWTFYHKPRGVSAVESIKEHCFGADWTAKHVVAMTATWDTVFAVVERDDPKSDVYVPDADGKTRALAVSAIKNSPRARDGFNFGYKDMSEAMGPYGHEAPLSILAKCSPLQDLPAVVPEYSSLKSAHEYRARSKAKAEAKALKRGLKPGDVVTLAEPLTFGGQKLQTFTVDHARVRGRKAARSTVFRAGGMLCSISPGNLVGATVVKP